MTNQTPEVFQYAIKNDGFNIWLGGKHLSAKDRVLTLNRAQHDELQELIASGRYDIRQELTYLDVAAAEKLAIEHQQSQRGAAHQGSVHSGAAAERQPNVLKEIAATEPPGLTLKQRLAASRENILSGENKSPETSAPLQVIEEGAVHAEDLDIK